MLTRITKENKRMNESESQLQHRINVSGITLSKRNVNSVNGFKKTVETMGYIIIEYIKQIEKQ